MDSKHTPGPWKYAGNNGTHSFDQSGRCIADSPRPNGMLDDEGVANAKLIAAAPELLEALRESVKALDSAHKRLTAGGNFADGIVIDYVRIKARSAIAKATI